MKRIIILLAAILFTLVAFAQNLKPIDKESKLKFFIKNFGFTVDGSFSGLQGTMKFDVNSPENSSFELSVESNSINTSNEKRDNHLRTEEYFNVKKYPKLNFISTKITRSEKPNTLLATGKLTIKGISKEISFPFNTTAKNDGYIFSGEFGLNRRDFQVGSGSIIMSDNLKVVFSIFARKS